MYDVSLCLTRSAYMGDSRHGCMFSPNVLNPLGTLEYAICVLAEECCFYRTSLLVSHVHSFKSSVFVQQMLVVKDPV